MTENFPPEELAATAVRTAGWDKLQPADGPWNNLVGDSATRDEVIEQLRGLADFLDERPEIPVPPSYATLYYTVFAAGTDQEKYAQVDYLSALLGMPVSDALADGGHYLVSVPFGGLTYQFVAISKEPVERDPVSFTAGQDVRIVPEVSGAFRRAGIAQAGVIMSAGPGDQYLVRLPGQKTITLPGVILRPADPVSVDVSSGTATSLAEVETRLVDAMARTRNSEHRDQAPDSRTTDDTSALTSALVRICGLPRGTLLAQLEPAISATAHQLADGGLRKSGAAQIAARDKASPGDGDNRSDRASRDPGRKGQAQLSARHRRQR
jgi:hypothetical protein